MKVFFILMVHLLVTLARLLGPGGARAIVAENLLCCSNSSYWCLA